ncbi:MAG: flagellin FliC [Bacteriovoracaceae bacterium]|nr:flagellin FliC [Bacteriovoracaceae bacterium]
MGFRVNTNVTAIASQRALGQVSRETVDSSKKLAKGDRISQAADDAAGLAISEKMKAHIRSSKQANRNANDGISMIQTAEGGLNESSSILTRMREMAIQAASDSVTDSERSMSSMEYEGLKQELERISQVTNFNGKNLLNGSSHQIDFQVGVGEDTSDDRISVNTSSFNSSLAGLGVASVSILSKVSAQESLSKIDTAFNKLSGQRAELGSVQNRLENSSDNLGVYTLNMSSANSRIRDLDYAEEASKQARNMIISQTSTAVGAQANSHGSGVLKLL